MLRLYLIDDASDTLGVRKIQFYDPGREPVLSRMVEATPSRAARLRPQRMSRHPTSASVIARAAPSPLPAPVTTATEPSIFFRVNMEVYTSTNDAKANRWIFQPRLVEPEQIGQTASMFRSMLAMDFWPVRVMATRISFSIRSRRFSTPACPAAARA